MCESGADKKKATKANSNGGLTLKLSPKKKKGSEVDSIVEIEKGEELDKGEELEIDSQSSLVKDIKKNASGADGPSW